MIIQESSKRADIPVVVKAYTPKPSRAPWLPMDDREIKHMIPNKFTGEDKIAQVGGGTFVTPSIKIEKYLNVAKKTCEQNCVNHERFCKYLYEGALAGGLAGVKVEKMKSINIKAFTTMEKAGTYPAGNLRASIYDWCVGIAELERVYIICFCIPVNKSLIMMKIKLMNVEVTKAGKALIREYSEIALGEYAKGN